MPLGALISVAALIPNVVWAVLPPSDLPAPGQIVAARQPRALVWIEQVARVGVFTAPFFYSARPLNLIERTASVVLLAALGVYYLCWFRYFAGGRCVWLLYQPLWGVPVPMAVTPVVYFAAASVVLHATSLAAAAVALSLSHIPLSFREARRLTSTIGPSGDSLT
jgi:hypothetical protein